MRVQRIIWYACSTHILVIGTKYMYSIQFINVIIYSRGAYSINIIYTKYISIYLEIYFEVFGYSVELLSSKQSSGS